MDSRPTTLPFTVLYWRTLICNSYSVVLITVNKILPFWLVHCRKFKFGKNPTQCNSVSGHLCSYSVVSRTVFKTHFWTFYTVWVLHCTAKARKKATVRVYYTGLFNLSAKNVFLSVAFASYSVVAKTVLVGRAWLNSFFKKHILK